MHRGSIRHGVLQLALGKNVKTVADFWRSFPKCSYKLNEAMQNLLTGATPGHRVYVFKEVALNRIVKQSRRADIVFYIPTVAIIYVEYKTVESNKALVQSAGKYETQLRETYDNLVANLSYKMSLPSPGPFREVLLKVYTVLLTRRYSNRRITEEDVRVHRQLSNTGIREKSNPSFMINLLSGFGRLF
ncbi:hypothetical protein RRG08_061496 [Elysia crispata]|uniref:Uncharacterized protein n=1 Tax=Elysia crispata TaxID=231223 RepID=A0AAE1CL37_9GAST|nr:hypothetical protein RRG08_061496 [Elysia crispata]